MSEGENEPVRVVGRRVVVTARPGASAETLRTLEEVVSLCDEAADMGLKVGEACEAYRAVFGTAMLIVLLEQLLAALREAACELLMPHEIEGLKHIFDLKGGQ